jgi:hypothetical protein
MPLLKSKKAEKKKAKPLIKSLKPPENDKSMYRADGTIKGTGFFGVQKMTDGSNRDMTEFSVGVDFGKGEMQIPTLVPTLTQEELAYLKNGNDPSKAIVDKAITHAKQRLSKGKSPFYKAGE